jgi:hypothetical protein
MRKLDCRITRSRTAGRSAQWCQSFLELWVDRFSQDRWSQTCGSRPERRVCFKRFYEAVNGSMQIVRSRALIGSLLGREALIVQFELGKRHPVPSFGPIGLGPCHFGKLRHGVIERLPFAGHLT